MEAVVAVLSMVGGMGAIGVGVVWALGKVDGSTRKRPKLSPREVLELRFANGDIDEDEFDRRLDHLMLNAPEQLD